MYQVLSPVPCRDQWGSIGLRWLLLGRRIKRRDAGARARTNAHHLWGGSRRGSSMRQVAIGRGVLLMILVHSGVNSYSKGSEGSSSRTSKTLLCWCFGLAALGKYPCKLLMCLRLWNVSKRNSPVGTWCANVCCHGLWVQSLAVVLLFLQCFH